MTDWELYLKRRNEGLGFISRLNAWREPTPAEKAAALALEINSWQLTKGKKPFTESLSYSDPKYKGPAYYGENLKATRAIGQKAEYREEAIDAYIETNINIGREFWVVMDWWTAIRHWFKGNVIDVIYTQEKK